MLNVGPLELLVVVAVALIVVGPERLPELARSVGRALRQLRQVQDEVRDMVAMGVDEDVRRAASDFKRTTSDLSKAADVKGAARTAGRAVRAEARKTLEPSARRSSAEAGSEPVADGPSAPDAPTAADGSALDGTDVTDTDAGETGDAVAEPEVAGPPADRLVEDASTSPTDADTTEPA